MSTKRINFVEYYITCAAVAFFYLCGMAEKDVACT